MLLRNTLRKLPSFASVTTTTTATRPSTPTITKTPLLLQQQSRFLLQHRRPNIQFSSPAPAQSIRNYQSSRGGAKLYPPPPPRKKKPQYNRFEDGGGKEGGGGGGGGGGPKGPGGSYMPLGVYIFLEYRNLVLGVGGVAAVVYWWNLEEVPVTHRRRFRIVSAETEAAMGRQSYLATLQNYQGLILPDWHPETRRVRKVLERLIPASGLQDQEWEVFVIDDPHETNAFVIPGGKVFVFTGILPICKDDNGIAAVLGHEIAHNVAHHAAERMSSRFITSVGLATLAIFFDISGQLSSMLFEYGFKLPNSRTQESEADHIGLYMMAESCYDPHAAIEFWDRMQRAQKGAPPQFLSTHPSSGNRVTALRELLPEAQVKLDGSNCGATIGYANAFKQTRGDFW